MSHYLIEVYARGVLVAHHTVEAADALSAINRVETEYGEPPKLEEKTIHHDDGRKETIQVVVNWHGYSFLARKLAH
jgi:hypothetical protein